MCKSISKMLFHSFHGVGTLREPSISYVTESAQVTQKIISFLSSLKKKKILFIFPKKMETLPFINSFSEKSLEEGLVIVSCPLKNENPSITDVEHSVHQYFSRHCDAIVAIGGGASLDLAKAVKARINHPENTVYQLVGYKNFRHRQLDPLLVVCPTTISAGEMNYTSHILDFTNHQKFFMVDRSLLPNYIVYCPELALQMPLHVLIGSFFSTLSTALEVLLQKQQTKAIEQADQGMQLLWKQTRFLDSVETLGSSSDQIETIYESMAELQQAGQLIGQASRKSSGGYFSSLNHVLHLLYQCPDYAITPVTCYAILRLYQSVLEKNEADALVQNYKQRIEECCAFVEEFLKKQGMHASLPDLKRADIPFIINYMQKDVRERANLSFYFKDEDLESMLNSLCPSPVNRVAR